MKNRILFTAVLATFALNGCNKQADVSVPPTAAPAPSETTAPPPAPVSNAPVYAPARNTPVYAPPGSPPVYAPSSDNVSYAPPGEYPAADIGLNVSDYPQLQQVPGYPVYYAPGVNSNYFFYDGMYWVYQRDNWYASSWYDGPWSVVAPTAVPLFVLRVPVRYYREPPAYFRGWREDAPPQWGAHYGRDWEEHRRGWDQWNRNSVPPPAPLPTYQREYPRGRYPSPVEQQTLHVRNYQYQPKDAAVEHVYHEETVRKAQMPQRPAQPPAPPAGNPHEFDKGRPGPQPVARPNEPAAQHPEQGRREENKGAPPPHQPFETRPAPQPVPQTAPQPVREPQREPQREPAQQTRPAAATVPQPNHPPEHMTPPHEQLPQARPVQEHPPTRPPEPVRTPQPEARPAPQPPHEQPAARPTTPPQREQPPAARPAPQTAHEQPAPRPAAAPPHEQPHEPPHEQPAARPAPPPQPKPQPPREEKKEEERK